MVTLVGTLAVARGRAMRALAAAPRARRDHGTRPAARYPAFPALLVCVAGLGFAFGVAGVAVPAYADQYAGHDAPESLAGVLLAVWGIGSAIGGIWFGTRRPARALTRQFAWLLAAVAASLALLAVMPEPAGAGHRARHRRRDHRPGADRAELAGRSDGPGAMRNEAYTWMITLSVAASAAGGSVAGLVVDHAGAGWAFLFAALAVGGTALVAGWPGGSLARAGAPAA